MKKILIINSNYYENISNNLLVGAKRKLFLSKYSLSQINVPGIFEIPIAIRRSVKKFDGFIALGCVIKGQTPHFDLISSSVFNAITKLSINFNSFGIDAAALLKSAYVRDSLYFNPCANKCKVSLSNFNFFFFLY